MVGVGELGRTGKGTEGLNACFRSYWVTWEVTGRHWKERIHSLKTPDRGSWSTRDTGCDQEEYYFSGCMVARVCAPEDTRCALL